MSDYSEHLISLAGGDGDPIWIREVRADALEAAAERFGTRSETLLKTMQNMADSREYDSYSIVRYGAYSAEANTTAIWLRDRAAELRKS